MGRAAWRVCEAACLLRCCSLVYNNCTDVVKCSWRWTLQKQAVRCWSPSHEDRVSFSIKTSFCVFKEETQACRKHTVEKHKVTQSSAVGLVVLTEGLTAGVIVSQSRCCESLWRRRLEHHKEIGVSVPDGSQSAHLFT